MSKRASALVRLAGALLTAVVLVAVAVSAAVPAAPALAQGATRVRMGLLGTITDAGIFIALDQGYFREQGLDVETTIFDSAAGMVAPLGTGQLEVGGGAHTAGMFNAVARGIAIKLVADKASALPGQGVHGLIFRRDLSDSGRLRAPGDLRGLRVAVPARGITTEVSLALWLRQGGLTLDDVDVTELGFPDQVSALGGRAIDAAVTTEPFVTRIVDGGLGTLYQRNDELFPGYQVAEVIYGAQFAQEQADAARRFMIAYLRGVRFYNDAFVKGDAGRRQEAIATLARHTTVREPALYDRMVMGGLHPDGRINLASLAEDQELWLARGIQQTRINLEDLVDYRFADAAVQALGPYR